jgi:hypothetical protein
MALQLFEIADVTVSSPQATITFSSIPQGYTDLKLFSSVRTTTADNFQLIRFSLNGVEGNFREVYGSNGSVGAGLSAQNRLGYSSGGSTTSNTFSNGELQIPNYTSTVSKTSLIDAVNENNSAVTVLTFAANITPTASPVTSINIFLESGAFATNSTFTLYGVL